MPSVSIVTSVYNEEANIQAYLDSLTQQTYRGFELTIVDDGSTDNTVSIIKEYQEKLSIDLIILPHQGWKLAKAEAYANASGDILIIFDADEIIQEKCVENLIEPFDDPQVGAVGGQITTTGNNWVLKGAKLGRELIHQLRKDQGEHALGIAAGCMALRRTAVEEVGGLSTTDKLIAQDIDISWRLRESNWKLLSVDEAVAIHRDPPTVKGLFKRQFTFGRKAVYTYWLHPENWLNWKLWGRFYPLVLLIVLPFVPTVSLALFAITFLGALWFFRNSKASFVDKCYGWAVLTIHSVAYSLGFIWQLIHNILKISKNAVSSS
jgi:cellulose synthase/poly-beta-1,6-N-acetylglucosamine synthase-like glycosyltransferase